MVKEEKGQMETERGLVNQIRGSCGGGGESTGFVTDGSRDIGVRHGEGNFITGHKRA